MKSKTVKVKSKRKQRPFETEKSFESLLTELLIELKTSLLESQTINEEGEIESLKIRNHIRDRAIEYVREEITATLARFNSIERKNSNSNSDSILCYSFVSQSLLKEVSSKISFNNNYERIKIGDYPHTVRQQEIDRIHHTFVEEIVEKDKIIKELSEHNRSLEIEIKNYETQSKAIKRSYETTVETERNRQLHLWFTERQGRDFCEEINMRCDELHRNVRSCFGYVPLSIEYRIDAIRSIEAPIGDSKYVASLKLPIALSQRCNHSDSSYSLPDQVPAPAETPRDFPSISSMVVDKTSNLDSEITVMNERIALLEAFAGGFKLNGGNSLIS